MKSYHRNQLVSLGEHFVRLVYGIKKVMAPVKIERCMGKSVRRQHLWHNLTMDTLTG